MNLPFFCKLILPGAVFFVGISLAYADDPDYVQVHEKVQNICEQTAKTPIPSQDQSGEKCNASDLYYGIGRPVDYVKARQCAYATDDYPTLTMIYANAKGTPRNWELAIHFACKAGFAQAEIDGRVDHLVQLRDKHWQGSDFDICDDITSGYMMGVCASRKEQQAEAQRQAQLNALMASWSEADKQAWRKLQTAMNQFFTARVANEVDLSGTARAAMEIEEEAALRDDLLTSLQSFSKGHLPAYSAENASKIDRQLNQVYQEIEKNSDFSMGTVDRAGVKKTQLMWLKYRDAWVAFGKVKYPQVDEDSWKTWLAEKRLKMLQDLDS
jgi:hypothetical protein